MVRCKGSRQAERRPVPAYRSDCSRCAVMFCYLTNSKKAYVEGTSSNPVIGRAERMAAISDCLVRISEKLVELGYSAVWSITAFDSLISVGEAHGFRCSQKDHAYLIKEF